MACFWYRRAAIRVLYSPFFRSIEPQSGAHSDFPNSFSGHLDEYNLVTPVRQECEKGGSTSRLSFALTMAVLFGAIVVLSAFALQNLFVSAPGNEDFAEATEEMTQATETTEETTTLQGGGDLKTPPDSKLSYGGREVRSSASGSYCWEYGNSSLCADGIVLTPPRKKTLSVPSGSEMVFRYGRQRPPNKVSATAYTLLAKENATGTRLGADRPLNAYGSGVERTIPAELPPEEYLVAVDVTEPQGQVSYIFRVMVRLQDWNSLSPSVNGVD